MSDLDRTTAGVEEESELDKSKAPLLDHLIELRRRLLWCVRRARGRRSASASISRGRSSAFLVQPLLAAGQGQLIYTEVFEAFFVRDQGRLLRAR